MTIGVTRGDWNYDPTTGEPRQGYTVPLTVDQLIGRLDVKCDEIMTRSRPTKGDVNGLVGLCRRLISAVEEEKRVASRNTDRKEAQ